MMRVWHWLKVYGSKVVIGGLTISLDRVSYMSKCVIERQLYSSIAIVMPILSWCMFNAIPECHQMTFEDVLLICNQSRWS